MVAATEDKQIINGQVLLARKPFRFAGKRFEPGMKFPYQQMSVAWRKVLTMYGSGLVIPEDDFEKSGLSKSGALVTEEIEEQEDTEQEEVPVKSGRTVPPPSENADSGVTIVNLDRGWFDVMDNGEKANDKKLRRDDAVKLAEELRARKLG